MVGKGYYIGGIIMSHNFQYISKHDEKVVSAYNNLIKMLNNIQNEIKNKFTFKYKIIGSYSRNMITCDSKSNIGFDLDVNIYPNDYFNEYSPQKIKTTLIMAFRKYLKKYKYSKIENSTRVITIKVNDTKNSEIIHSVDFAIVNNYENDEGYQCQKYIRFNKKRNSYTWEEQDGGFYMLDEKIEWIKDEDLWQELRVMYLKRKNSNNDLHKKSRALFAESVNNICNEYGYFE